MSAFQVDRLSRRTQGHRTVLYLDQSIRSELPNRSTLKGIIEPGTSDAALPLLGGGTDDGHALSARLRAAATYALWFLQAHVGGNADAARRLADTPEAEGFPAGLVEVSRRPAR